MSFTPTKQELEELGFKHSGNVRKPYEYFIVNDIARIRFFQNSGICETTVFSLIPTYRQYIPSSLSDLKTIISSFYP